MKGKIIKKTFLSLFFLSLIFYFPFILLAESLLPQDSRYGGKLVLATTSDPKSFNPILAKETSTTVITNLIFEGLTRINGITTEVEPNLALSWQRSQDGLEWTFRLRQDVFWSDGARFTAEDVVFTFNSLIFNPAIPTSSRDIFTIRGKTIKVEKLDDFTVRFRLPAKFAPFLRAMAQEILPQHLLKKYTQESKFNSAWGLDSKPEEIVGTGPFMLADYVPGQKVELVRNPAYWKRDRKGRQLPYLERVIFLIVQNQDTMLLKFQDGELDYYPLRGQDYPLLKPLEKKGNFTIYRTGPAFGSNFLVFNQNKGRDASGRPFVDPKKLAWFSSKGFRQAVAYSIDRRSIIDIVMNGLGYPQYSPLSPSAGFFYNPEVKRYEYDPRKAREILKKEGFADRDGDGFLEDKQGNVIEFNLFTNSGSTQRVKIAAIIRKDLENLGFKVNFMQLEFNNLVTKLDSTFDWDAVILGLTGGIEPHFGKNVWNSGGHLHLWFPRQTSPATRWEAEIDEIFERGVQELDPQKRKALYDRWQEIVAEEVPLIYTVLPETLFAVRDKFGNLYPSAYGGAFHNLEEIYVKK
jgi:peptide/nickel transport system substrate-binding protein